MNDNGDYMYSNYRGKWIPDTQGRRNAIISRLRSWTPFSNSSPVEGVTKAIRSFYSKDKKISIYVFGDEFSGGSIESVIKTIDNFNRNNRSGKGLVRIHAVGFPVMFDPANTTNSTLEPCEAISGLEHLHVCGAETQGDQLPNVGLVLDHQNALHEAI